MTYVCFLDDKPTPVTVTSTEHMTASGQTFSALRETTIEKVGHRSLYTMLCSAQ